ncbi:MAG TPA: beta-propeller fold lactonase family protein, partial [Gemmatimonadaceae bacterium]|nr:beta-propeller fold lactonase family protein [Gemmatimonadaceae bacterium]
MRTSWSALLLVAAVACSDRTISAPLPSTALVGASRIGAPNDLADGGIVGGVFTETDDATGNAVVAFARYADGTLRYIANYPTDGLGLGGANVVDPLQSQYAVALTPDHRYLYAVNAGSNSVAAFAIKHDGLEKVGTYPSNGTTPVSLAATDRVLYVLNKGSNTVAGFRIDHGQLVAQPGLTRSLSPIASGAAAIRFDRDAHLLAVTERVSNTIDVFTVHEGRLSATPVLTHSAGAVPFGFDWTPRHQLVASEAGSGSASSYAAFPNGSLSVRSAAVSTLQSAPCWLIATHDGRFVYTANAGSNSVTGFAVSPSGTLAILTTGGKTGVLGAGATPLDLDVSQDSKFLYVLKAGSNTIGA